MLVQNYDIMLVEVCQLSHFKAAVKSPQYSSNQYTHVFFDSTLAHLV